MATRTIPADWYTTAESLERDRAAVLHLGLRITATTARGEERREAGTTR